jgi:hypothetical protein
MALILSCKKRKAAHEPWPGAPPSRGYLPLRVRKSSKSGYLPTGKIIPQTNIYRLRNDWNEARFLTVTAAKPIGRFAMYIGLGGLLILILILWLLGVI